MRIEWGSTMQITSEQALHSYANAYVKLYNRHPRDMRALDPEWVLVNGAQMHAHELMYLTAQLVLEYKQGQARKRNLVNRLIGWLKQ